MTDRQIPLVLSIEDGERNYGGNDLTINGTLVGHRKYDGSYLDDIEAEVRQAVARMLLRELQSANPRDWTAEREDEG